MSSLLNKTLSLQGAVKRAIISRAARNLAPAFQQLRFMATEKTIKTPSMGESITEGTLTQWHKKIGEYVERDEQIATIETDKIDVQVNAPESGKVLDLFAAEGDTVAVGADLFKIELGDVPEGQKSAPVESKPTVAETKPEPTPVAPPKPAAAPTPTPAAKSAPPPPAPSAPKPVAPSAKPVAIDDLPGYIPGVRTERSVKMNRMRSTIAKRLKESQNIAASLTTFNEVDMSALVSLRKKYKDAVLDKHGVKLGFMGAFLKAASSALLEIPAINARIEGENIVYSDFVDISVAVSTPKGLVTPVLRNCETLNIVQLEQALAALGKKAKNNEIAVEDMAGGTFTISNGGVFGSLYGTPIINRPQSAILGMHAVKDRAVVVDGQVVVRPMMYIALTYDHRLIDGREATTFLVKVKEAIEDPARLLLSV
ncbi:2-oxoglutarate dehydrogenase complex E2 component [Boothiomyces macroporosus]|uniref:dihydrolipoyllysine-residue succinyltransferase n=1 Tax=Boothiomyces macroporosus TaxID=261099 RepID=A0AAD5UMP6_9FUNG|nr:2-oxoglutarate dehydrogenase complex E2 component [Boothiomyces macroporosus]